MVNSSYMRLAVCGGLLALSACSTDGLTRTFGLTRDAPDEFTVTTRAPLSVPPDLPLRAPQPGAPRPQEDLPGKTAEAALAPSIAMAAPSGSDSPGQQALLQAAGPAAPSDIRAKLAAEAAGAQQDRSLTDRLMFWSKPDEGKVVDAGKEAERLKTDAALGQSPDAGGDTPVLKTKHHGWFDWLF